MLDPINSKKTSMEYLKILQGFVDFIGFFILYPIHPGVPMIITFSSYIIVFHPI